MLRKHPHLTRAFYCALLCSDLCPLPIPIYSPLQENLALYKRLQQVKPSSNISNAVLAQAFKQAQGYGANVRKVKPHVSTPSPPG